MDKIKETNLNNIVSYFREGCKDAFLMGLELEHFVVDAKGTPLSYSGEIGVEALLKELSESYTEKVCSNGHLIGMWREDAAISIEPAGQLEVSISPQTDVEKILEIYKHFREEVDGVLAKWNCTLIEAGYLPKGKAREQELLPKTRYQYMDAYFAKIGEYGCCMMRGTAATQVSVDYADEKDFVRKYQVAYKLMPLFSWITDNVPVFEDEPNEKSLIRTKIWRGVDPGRTNLFAYLQGSALSFRSYADFVYHTPLIVGKIDGEEFYTEKTAEELYADKVMSRGEMEHVLSMVFPNIRLKKVLELRGADSLPIGEAVGYMLLVKGLLRTPDVVAEWLKANGIETVADADVLTDKLLLEGNATKIKGKSLVQLSDELFALAEQALEEKERKYLSGLKQRVHNKIV